MSHTTINCNIRGTEFLTTLATVSSHGENKIFKMATENAVINHAEIFFDRDPVIFRYILNYLCGYKHFLPDVRSELKMLSEDAEFYEINELKDEVNKLLKSPKMFKDIFASDYQEDIQSNPHADDCVCEMCEDNEICEVFSHADDCNCIPCRDSRYYHTHNGQHHPECTCLQRGGTECTSVVTEEDINSYDDVVKTITDNDNDNDESSGKEMGQMPNLGALFKTLSSLKNNIGQNSSDESSGIPVESEKMLADLQGMTKMLTDTLSKMN